MSTSKNNIQKIAPDLIICFTREWHTMIWITVRMIYVLSKKMEKNPRSEWQNSEISYSKKSFVDISSRRCLHYCGKILNSYCGKISSSSHECQGCLKMRFHGTVSQNLDGLKDGLSIIRRWTMIVLKTVSCCLFIKFELWQICDRGSAVLATLWQIFQRE
jgi:hypothetical protein